MKHRSKRGGTDPAELARVLALQLEDDAETRTGWVKGVEVVLRGDVLQVRAPEGFTVSPQVRRRLPEGTVLTPHACHVSLRRQGVTRTAAIVRQSAAVLADAARPEQVETWRDTDDPRWIQHLEGRAVCLRDGAEALRLVADAGTDRAALEAVLRRAGGPGAPALRRAVLRVARQHPWLRSDVFAWVEPSLDMVDVAAGDRDLEVVVLGRFVATGFADGLMALADGSTDEAHVVAAIDALGQCGGTAARSWLEQRGARWFLPAAQRRAIRHATAVVAQRLGVGALSVAGGGGELAVVGP